jgi:hypothetical protein
MEQKKDLSVINCIATAMIAYFFTIPLHELFHLITFYAYGDKCYYITSFNVEYMKLIDYYSLPYFHRILATGGSASILNTIIGIVVLIIILKVKMRPIMRMFCIQYMGLHLNVGFGYFMNGGMVGLGDWGNVFSYFKDDPGFIAILRIILTAIGFAGAIALFFVLNYMAYFFVEDPSNKKERRSVAAKLYLTMFFVGVIALIASYSQNPAIKDGSLSLKTIFVSPFMYIGFVWGFLFTGFLVKPPKENRFIYKLPEQPNIIILAVGIVLILVNTFVSGQGIYLN